MSSNPGRREVAYRVFATEFEDAELSYSEGDEERAPNYVVSPTGARINRLFAAGVLTEVEDVNPEMARGRVVDPTGGFVTYAGQYQPEALSFLERADPPAFVALSGKARTFEPENGDRIFTSVRPESINEIDAETRDRWVVSTAERTLDRIGLMAAAIEADLVGDELRAALVAEGVDERLADGVVLAQEYYGTTSTYLEGLRDVSIDAVRVVADEVMEVDPLSVAPDDTGGTVEASELASLDLTGAPTPQSAAAAAGLSGSDTESVDGTDRSSEVSEPESDESSEVSETEAAGVESAPVDDETGSIADGPVSGDDEPETAEEELGPANDESKSSTDDEYEMDEETRRKVEAEFGTEFSTADDLGMDESATESEAAPTESTTDEESIPEPGSFESTGEPGSIDSETSESSSDSDVPTESDDGSSDKSTTADDAETGSTDASADVDLAVVVIEVMGDLDEGDGAPREEIVSTVADDHGLAAEVVEEAIEDALMSGQCYEPADGRFKPI